MRYLIAFVFVVSVYSLAKADSPFCVESSAGRVCDYYDGPSCRQAAAAANGTCVINTKVTIGDSTTGTATSRFCVVNQLGRHCHYTEHAACMQAAADSNGTCEPNK